MGVKYILHKNCLNTKTDFHYIYNSTTGLFMDTSFH